MRFTVSAALLIGLLSAGPARAAERQRSNFEEKPIAVFAQLGAGTPLGYAGLEVEGSFLRFLALSVGAGMGETGRQVAAMSRLRFAVDERAAFVLGAGLSDGEYTWTHTPFCLLRECEATIKRGQFQVDYTLAGAADGIEATYLDASDWKNKVIRVAAPGVTTPLNPARIALEGVTVEERAAEQARYHLGQSLYQYKSIQYGTDLEHLSYRRLSVLALQHDLTQWGYGGRVQAAEDDGTVTLTLDEPVPAPASGNAYIGLRIPGEDVYRVFQVASFEGTSKVITLGTPHRGALNALLSLVNGVRKGFGPVGVDGWGLHLPQPIPWSAIQSVHWQAFGQRAAYIVRGTDGSQLAEIPSPLPNEVILQVLLGQQGKLGGSVEEKSPLGDQLLASARNLIARRQPTAPQASRG